MIHFRILGYRVALKIHRPRRVTREQLEQAGVIVCGPDTEAQMLADSEREMHEYEVLTALYERVSEGVDRAIVRSGEILVGPAADRASRDVREFLRDIRDIAGRMHELPPHDAAAGEG